jgi:hypothetical protein
VEIFLWAVFPQKNTTPLPIDGAETGRKIIVAGVVHAFCEQRLNYTVLRFLIFGAKKRTANAVSIIEGYAPSSSCGGLRRRSLRAGFSFKSGIIQYGKVHLTRFY